MRVLPQSILVKSSNNFYPFFREFHKYDDNNIKRKEKLTSYMGAFKVPFEVIIPLLDFGGDNPGFVYHRHGEHVGNTQSHTQSQCAARCAELRAGSRSSGN